MAAAWVGQTCTVNHTLAFARSKTSHGRGMSRDTWRNTYIWPVLMHHPTPEELLGFLRVKDGEKDLEEQNLLAFSRRLDAEPAMQASPANLVERIFRSDADGYADWIGRTCQSLGALLYAGRPEDAANSIRSGFGKVERSRPGR